MEKRLGVNLRKGHVNRITAMLNRFVLGKTRPGEEIWTWKNNSWDGYCKQCCKVVETMSHIFECEKDQENLDTLGMNVSVQRVYGVQTLLGDHYLWSDHKKRSRVFTQFSATIFFIAEIMRCWLNDDEFSWWRTKFKLVAYISNLLGSNDIKFDILGEELKEMLNIHTLPGIVCNPTQTRQLMCLVLTTLLNKV